MVMNMNNPLLFASLGMLGAGLEGRQGFTDAARGLQTGFTMDRQIAADERRRRMDEAAREVFGLVQDRNASQQDTGPAVAAQPPGLGFTSHDLRQRYRMPTNLLAGQVASAAPAPAPGAGGSAEVNPILTPSGPTPGGSGRGIVQSGPGLTFSDFIRQNRDLGPLIGAMGGEQGLPLLASMYMQARRGQKPVNRPTARNAAGYLVYTDTGERVDPSAVAPAPKGTSAQQNALALGLVPGTPEYNDYIRQVTTRPASTVNVNTGPTGIDYGDPPKDYAWARDSQGNVLLEDTGGGRMAPVSVPVVGGPAAQEQAAAAEAEAARAESQGREADLVLDEISRANEILSDEDTWQPVTGTLGRMAAVINESEAAKLQRRLGTIRANIGFGKLRQMREESPTGGALGNVTIGEIERLERVMGDLENSQTREELEYNLERLQFYYEDMRQKAGGTLPSAAEPRERASGNRELTYNPATGELE